MKLCLHGTRNRHGMSTHPVRGGNIWTVYQTPSPDVSLIVCSMCMLQKCLFTRRKLSRLDFSSSAAEHLISQLIDVIHFGVAAVKLTFESLNDVENLIWKVTVVTKFSECFSKLLVMSWNFQGFKLPLPSKFTISIISSPLMKSQYGHTYILSQCCSHFCDIDKPD